MLPITIVTGWLGSGKTTLLNRILGSPHGLRIAVVQNEFGEIGVDGDLVIGAGFPVVELSNGCLCCAVNDDFLAVLEELPGIDSPPDHVIVETSGVADPSATVLSILRHPDHEETFVVDGVVGLVDALNVESQLNAAREVAAQIAFADRLLLNKIDLLDSDRLPAIRSLLHGINPSARLVECRNADVPVDELLDIGGFDLSRVSVGTAVDSTSLDSTPHSHTDIAAHSFLFGGSVDFERFEQWIADVLRTEGGRLYRMKGIVRVEGNRNALVLQGVRSLYSWRYASPIAEGEENRVVFIGVGIERQRLLEGLKRCVADPRSLFSES